MWHVLQKIWNHPQLLRANESQGTTRGMMLKGKSETKILEEIADEENDDVILESANAPAAIKYWWHNALLPECSNRDLFEQSGKICVALELIKFCVAKKEKVLLFTQSLGALDLVERALQTKMDGIWPYKWAFGRDYLRLEGKTSARERKTLIDQFSAKSSRPWLFLMSVKAGGLGVNLVSASRVIIFDSSWNPSHDIQAIFRAYRIGQAKSVHVYRLVASGTMENRIYSRQLLKQGLFLRVVDEQNVSRAVAGVDNTKLFEYNSADDLGSESDQSDADNAKKKTKKKRGPRKKKDDVEEIDEATQVQRSNEKKAKLFSGGDDDDDDAVIVISDSDDDRKATNDKEDSKEASQSTGPPWFAHGDDALEGLWGSEIGRMYVKKCRDHDSFLAIAEDEKMSDEDKRLAWEQLDAPPAHMLQQQMLAKELNSLRQSSGHSMSYAQSPYSAAFQSKETELKFRQWTQMKLTAETEINAMATAYRQMQMYIASRQPLLPMMAPDQVLVFQGEVQRAQQLYQQVMLKQQALIQAQQQFLQRSIQQAAQSSSSTMTTQQAFGQTLPPSGITQGQIFQSPYQVPQTLLRPPIPDLQQQPQQQKAAPVYLPLGGESSSHATTTTSYSPKQTTIASLFGRQLQAAEKTPSKRSNEDSVKS